METLVFAEIVKAYGLPIAMALFIGYAVWSSRNKHESAQSADEVRGRFDKLDGQYREIRDMLVRIETRMEANR